MGIDLYWIEGQRTRLCAYTRSTGATHDETHVWPFSRQGNPERGLDVHGIIDIERQGSHHFNRDRER